MNDTLKVIQQRRSTRKYANTPVSSEEKEAILQAAMRAPTAGNMMLYTIIEVEDQTLKDRLAVTCDNQPFIAKAMSAERRRFLRAWARRRSPLVVLDIPLLFETGGERACDAVAVVSAPA